MLGAIYLNSSRHTEAITAFSKTVALNPKCPKSLSNLGYALSELNRFSEAELVCRKAIRLNQDYAPAYNNLGIALKGKGAMEEAVDQFKRAIAIRPNFFLALNNLGTTLEASGYLSEAEAEAVLSKLIFLAPQMAVAFNNLGNVQQKSGKYQEALRNYEKAISLNPNYPDGWYNIGICLRELGALQKARKAFQRSESIDPRFEMASAQAAFIAAKLCIWREDFRDMTSLSKLGLGKIAVSPFALLPFDAEPKNQLNRARNFADHSSYNSEKTTWRIKTRTSLTRLKICYLGADFHNHATMHLLSGVFRLHDHNKFEIFVYSYGTVTDEVTVQLKKRSQFYDISKMSDRDVKCLARDHEIDIAIDLKGYTQGARPSLIARRLAPVQLSWLGYPGTLGISNVDYIVADEIVIPKAQQKYYSEKVLYLPYSYQPNDNLKIASAQAPSRASENLPEGSFVFCCFNNSYKISSAEFDIWMRALLKVGDSVLWLFNSNPWMNDNLRNEAARRDVNPNRLVFAEQIGLADHLARHKHADLFLDTFNYNAHTTASDALWAGLPVVTKLGEGFAARVAASLLEATGLSELVTRSKREYEELIIDLATDREGLRNLTDRLKLAKDGCALFDTETFVRHLEHGLALAHQDHCDNSNRRFIQIPK